MKPSRSINTNRPVMRYPGAKFSLASWIISHFPPHDIYTETFGGGAAVLMQKRPARVEVYNDIDSNVVNVFRVLRDPDLSKKLTRQIYLTPYSREEHENCYDFDIDNRVECARRFILNCTFSIKKGPYKKTGFDTRINDDLSISKLALHFDYPFAIQHFCERLRQVIIENKSADKILSQFDRPKALHYVDPEYLNTSKPYKHKIGMPGHEHLTDVLLRLEGMVVLSGYDNDLYRSKLESAGWHKVRRKGYADGGHRRIECLWINPKAMEGRSQKSLFNNHQS